MRRFSRLSPNLEEVANIEVAILKYTECPDCQTEGEVMVSLNPDSSFTCRCSCGSAYIVEPK